MADNEFDNTQAGCAHGESDHEGGCCGHGGEGHSHEHGHGGGCCGSEGGHDHGHGHGGGDCGGHGHGESHGHGGCGHGGCGGHGHGHAHVPEGRMSIGTRDGFVDRSMHESASIASASMHLAVDAQAAQGVLKNVMTELGRWVEDGGGTIGHIKCTIIEQNVTAMSLTADEVQLKNPDGVVGLQFASIVFGIDPEELQIKVWNLLFPLAL